MGSPVSTNEVYKASKFHLRTKNTDFMKCLKVSKAAGEEDLTFTFEAGQEIFDIYEGI